MTMNNPEACNLRFLLVEDHPVQRRMLSHLLRGLGAAQVHEAADGEQAMRALEHGGLEVDVVLSDVGMPGTDGFELMHALARLRPQTPVILCSAMRPDLLAEARQCIAGLELRLLGLLPKPVTPEAVRALLPHPPTPA
jgi:CheY-like chemotaxis protein